MSFALCILSYLFCSISSVLSLLFYLFCPISSALPVLFYLLCSICSVLFLLFYILCSISSVLSLGSPRENSKYPRQISASPPTLGIAKSLEREFNEPFALPPGSGSFVRLIHKVPIFFSFKNFTFRTIEFKFRFNLCVSTRLKFSRVTVLLCTSPAISLDSRSPEYFPSISLCSVLFCSVLNCNIMLWFYSVPFHFSLSVGKYRSSLLRRRIEFAARGGIPIPPRL